MTPCTNCGEAAADVFCARCGEQQPGHHDLSLRHLAQHTLHELVHLDSKLFLTLKELVACPGFVPQEYFAGRKTRYIPPLRFFLTLFAIQFLAFTVYRPAALYSITSFKRFDTNGALTHLVAKRARTQHLPQEEFEARVDERWHKNLSLLQLANVLGVAVVLKVLHRRRYFAEHLVFSSYFLGFSYIVTLLFWPLYAVYGFHPGPLQRTLTGLTIAILLVYLFLAQRRFYGQGNAKTAVKTALLWGGNYVVAVLIFAGSLIAALLQAR
jgi:hypothetical protein